jgi:hypothetical protein
VGDADAEQRGQAYDDTAEERGGEDRHGDHRFTSSCVLCAWRDIVDTHRGRSSELATHR